MARRLSLLALLLPVLSPVPMLGQARPLVGVDVALRSKSVWRGITRHDGPVVQADAFASLWSRELSVTGGAWASLAFTAADSSRVGFGETFLGESAVWIEVTGTVGSAVLAVGWTGHFFDTEGALGPAAGLKDTHEVYGRLGFPTLPVVAPRITVYYDIDAVQGAYVEPGITLRVPLWAGLLLPAGSLLFDATAGFGAGQTLEQGGGDFGYYEGSGLTHLDVSAAVTVGRLALGVLDAAVHLELLHVQFNRDERTRISDTVGGEADVTVWFGVVVSLLAPRCRPEDRICANE